MDDSETVYGQRTKMPSEPEPRNAHATIGHYRRAPYVSKFNSTALSK